MEAKEFYFLRLYVIHYLYICALSELTRCDGSPSYNKNKNKEEYMKRRVNSEGREEGGKETELFLG